MGEEVAGISHLEINVAEWLDETYPFPRIRKTFVAKAAVVYVAGYLARKLISIVKNCELCKQLLLYSNGNIPSEIIEGRNFTGKSLVTPGSFLYYVALQSVSILLYMPFLGIVIKIT